MQDLSNKFLLATVISKRSRQLIDQEMDSALESRIEQPILYAINELKNNTLNVVMSDEPTVILDEADDNLDSLYADLKVKEDITIEKVFDDIDELDEPSDEELSVIDHELSDTFDDVDSNAAIDQPPETLASDPAEDVNSNEI